MFNNKTEGYCSRCLIRLVDNRLQGVCDDCQKELDLFFSGIIPVENPFSSFRQNSRLLDGFQKEKK